MADIKHVGRVKSTGRKCLVVFRTLPNDAFNCLVVLTEHLAPSYHDALINLVESNAGQSSFEFADVLNRNIFSDGMNMLQALHVQGMLTKMPTDQIEMTPNASSVIMLAELNQLIAQHRGISVQDLAIKPDPKSNVEVNEVATVQDISPTAIGDQADLYIDSETAKLLKEVEQPLTDEQLANKYRADAERLLQEAAELNKLANDLAPPVVTEEKKKPARSTKKVSA